MSDKKLLITEEVLEEIVFERSKWWSTFLEEVQMTDDLAEPIHLNDIEKVYGNDTDEGKWTDLDEAEEIEDDADDPEILDVTTAQEKKSFIESSEVQDILNATVPILEEHKRKWKEAGLERVLNTFDSVRIEKEVGGWMRRNHTSNISTAFKPASDSDSDSMLSSETADYIRSTRKKCTQRRRTCMAYLGRFKEFQRLHHKHGTVFKETTYRAYNCKCGKLSAMMEEDERKRQRRFAQQDMEVETPLKQLVSLRPQSERRLQRFNGEYSSSSDSDYVACEKRSPIERMLPPTRARESLFKKNPACCARDLVTVDGHRNRLDSISSSKFETPPKSALIQHDFTKTAPCKIGKKRQAADEALKKLCQRKNDNKKDYTEQNGTDNAVDHDTIFERDLERAIALSLKTMKASQNKRKTSVKERRRNTSMVSNISRGTTKASNTETLQCSNEPATCLAPSLKTMKVKQNKRKTSVKERRSDTSSDSNLSIASTVASSTEAMKSSYAPTIQNKIKLLVKERQMDSSETMKSCNAPTVPLEHSVKTKKANQNKRKSSVKERSRDTSSDSDMTSSNAPVTKNKRKSFNERRRNTSCDSIRSAASTTASSIGAMESPNTPAIQNKRKSIVKERRKDTSETVKLCNALTTPLEPLVKTKDANQNIRKSSVKERRRDTSSDSNRSTTSTIASNAHTIKSSNASTIPSETTLMLINHDREGAKENTFMAHQANICNSTALTTAAAAARQQLPSIAGNSEVISSTRYDGGPRKKISAHMPRINEYSLYGSDTTMRIVKPNFKKVLHSTALNNLATHKEVVLSATPRKQQLVARISDTPECASDKRNLQYGPASTTAQKVQITNERKSIYDANKLSTPPHPSYAAVPRRSVTSTAVAPATPNGPKRCSIAKERKLINDINKIATPPHPSNAAETRRSVTSTNAEKNTKRILVYKPQKNQETSTGCFQVTREILSSIIGDRDAQRFMKYNIGKLIFPITSTIYFCPPDIEFSSSDSDDDPLERIALFGELCESE